MFEIVVGTPDSFSDEDIQAAARLTKAGGALPATEEVIALRIRRSRRLGLCKVGPTVVGVVSIKEPSPNYRKGVFQKAEALSTLFSAAPELGYVTIHKEWRGRKLAQKLVGAALQELTETCYATTDDASMKAILSKVLFSQLGKEWKGARGVLSLWTLNDRSKLDDLELTTE